MKISSCVATVVFGLQLCIGSAAIAASACQQFRIEGNQIVFESDNGPLQSGSLTSLATQTKNGEILVLDFPQSQLCVDDSSRVDTKAASEMTLNARVDELAVRGFIDGSYDILLRLDLNYQAELVLERSVGEDIGLTEMEFLSDNSGVGAEDFFSEEIGFLELGDLELAGLFAEVPRYGIAYDHYAAGGVSQLDSESMTRGSLGLAVLRDMVLTLDFGSLAASFKKP